MPDTLPIRPRQDHQLAPASCAPNTFSFIPPTGETRPWSVICRQTSLISEWARVKKGGSFLRTSPVMLASHGTRNLGGAHFSVNRDTIEQTCIRPLTVILAISSRRKNTPQKSGPHTMATPACGPSFFCAPADAVGPPRFAGDATVIRVRLGPD